MAGKKRSKRYQEACRNAPQGKVSVEQAVKILKEFPAGKFDQTVELAMHLGIDPRQADQALRGAISMPNGIGATRKVIVFCEGDDTARAKEAGAIEAGGDELIKKIQDGWMDFDVAISTPAMMRSASRLGRILGPQGKMPSPKTGTVVDDVATAVREYAAGKVEYRNDDGGNLHMAVGKMSFEAEKLVENINFFIDYIRRLRPPTAKGVYMRKAAISATMSPGIELET